MAQCAELRYTNYTLNRGVYIMEFENYVGNASTSAWLDGKFVGSDVSAACYRTKNNTLMLQAENSRTPIRDTRRIYLTVEQYNDMMSKYSSANDATAMRDLLNQMGLETSFDNRGE